MSRQKVAQNVQTDFTALPMQIRTLLAREPSKVQSFGLIGPAGVAKTTWCKTVLPTLLAEARGVDVDDIGLVCVELGQASDAEAVTGYTIPVRANPNDPNDRRMVSRKTMPTVAEDIDAQVAAGKENGVFLIDEYSQCVGDIQKALRTALNRDDHRLGNYNLPEGWIVVWTGNRVQDNSGAVAMLAHAGNVTLKYELSLSDSVLKGWRDWCGQNNINSVMVNAAMHFQSEKVNGNNFFADAMPANGEQVATPRSVVNASYDLDFWMAQPDWNWKLEEWQVDQLAAGIGIGAAGAVAQYIAHMHELPSFEEVMADPMGCKLPDNTGYQDLIANNLVLRGSNSEEADAAMQYMTRIRPDLSMTTISRLLVKCADAKFMMISPLARDFQMKHHAFLAIAQESLEVSA